MNSFQRIYAMIAKEFAQLRRDRATFAMIVGIPIMQLLLFGYAINTNPRHLPSVLLLQDDGPEVRALVQELEASEYFRFVEITFDPQVFDRMIRRGEALVGFEIPGNFSNALATNQRTSLLLVVDATDPQATAFAIAAAQAIIDKQFRRDPSIVQVITHRRYNPSQLTEYHLIPGLLGVILTMTMTMFTAMSITREKEHGTIEMLLSMPIRPLEIMIGKIAPFILIGAIQMMLILVCAYLLFGITIAGSLLLVIGVTLLYVTVCLAIGYLISTIAKTQIQAMQMSFFQFLPSILLSGFMFPFDGMPRWAQYIGEAIPLTHYLRVIRAIILKGAGHEDIQFNSLILLGFLVFLTLVATRRFRQTLD